VAGSRESDQKDGTQVGWSSSVLLTGPLGGGQRPNKEEKMQSKLTMLIAIAAVCVTTLWAAWGPEEQLTNSDYYGNYSPYVVVGTNNYRHVVWDLRDHANVHRYYKRWYPKSGWTSAYKIVSPAKYCAGNFALALDGNATDIHFVWQAYDGGSVAQRAWYAKCVPDTKGTGKWGKSICLTPDRRTSTVDVVGFNDRVAVAFALSYGTRPGGDTWQTNPEVGFKECIGKTWQATQYIDLGIKAGGVSIAADAQARYGDVYYLYQYQDNAYVMRRVGGDFKPAELAATGVSQATIEVDPGTGFPHIVCCCKPDGEPSRVYHTYRDDAGDWQQLAMVSEENSEYSTSPRMCFSGGQACVVWDDSTGDVHGIKYAIGGYGSWTRGWISSGHSGWYDGQSDVAPVPGGGLYAVWSDGRGTPTQVWGSLYTPDEGDGGNAEPMALAQSSIEMSPNPARAGRVTVRYTLPHAGQVTVALLDVSGRLVRQSAICNPKSEVALDLKGLRPGVYVLKFESGTTSQTRKLVIQ